MCRRLRRLPSGFGRAETRRAPARRYALSLPLQPKTNLLFLRRKCADRGRQRGAAALLKMRNCFAIPLSRDRRLSIKAARLSYLPLFFPKNSGLIKITEFFKKLLKRAGFML